ncbi:hypothetical protein D477_009348 [Arthrobacter crystallopoietes BAB-32]|uniref:Uncharacterized protein n=1 Tax=Arthrobacter crystallopoietes BAB-32 TaxID=1246476 RepID=N1UVR6_9MICC|nr:hypothetical protein [Arthrobacter crystallopoietes]EMY34501.1 hypothetical protein D477_009348 [Arthrobacter crystallopoietes BAB-32]
MNDPLPTGALRHVLLPQTLGRHHTPDAEFIVLSVEIWSTGLVVNVQVTSAARADAAEPGIFIEDHLGTVYAQQGTVAMGSRQLHVFTPTVPAGARSLTIKSKEAGTVRQVVVFAVPAQGIRGRRLKAAPHRVAVPPSSPFRQEAG